MSDGCEEARQLERRLRWQRRESAGFRRNWCCGTLLTGPHIAGCDFEPRPDEPIDYSGSVEIRQPQGDT